MIHSDIHRTHPKAAATKTLSGYKICRFAQFPEGKKSSITFYFGRVII